MAHLEGQLIRLRAAEASDADALNPAFSDPDVLATLGSVRFPQSTHEFRAFVEHTREDATFKNFAIERLDTGEGIGLCGLMGLNLHEAPELGIWIGQAHWDAGFGTDAVRTLSRHAFADVGVHRVTLSVLASNERGQRAYSKVGFKHEGTLRQAIFTGGAWRDIHYMGLLADELTD